MVDFFPGRLASRPAGQPPGQPRPAQASQPRPAGQPSSQPASQEPQKPAPAPPAPQNVRKPYYLLRFSKPASQARPGQARPGRPAEKWRGDVRTVYYLIRISEVMSAKPITLNSGINAGLLINAGRGVRRLLRPSHFALFLGARRLLWPQLVALMWQDALL